jgi:cell wall-associated NlpC family hydrolase
VGSVRRQARRAAVVSVLLLGTLVAGSGVGSATPPPPPTPPPNPSDQQLDQSKRDMAGKAGEVGKLTGRLAEAEAESERLGEQLQVRQEDANRALVDQQNAQDAAAAAARAATAARAETEAASVAIEAAHQRLDEFIAVAYAQGADAGSLGVLAQAANPEDVVRRAELTQALADEQQAALEAMQRARVEKANADSRARAAEEQARAAAEAAEAAKRAADGEVADAQREVRAGLAELARVDALKVSLEKQLDDLATRDAGLRAQRQRYLEYQAQQAAAAAAEQKAAAGRVVRRAGVSGGVSEVIDRALSQLGVTYAWGGGNGSGPTRGIRDGGVADYHGDYRKNGFDCSGLMIYAFGAAGIGLPHYSGYQYSAGKKVPISDIRPGDLLFWGERGRIHHVALFLGDGKMVEAPYSGGKVRVTPVRYGGGLMPYATRLL